MKQFTLFEDLANNSTEFTPRFSRIVSEHHELRTIYEDVIYYASVSKNPNITKLFNAFKAAINLPGAVENNQAIVGKFFLVLHNHKKLKPEEIRQLFSFMKLINAVNQEMKSKNKAS